MTEQNKQPSAEAGERVGSVTISDFRGYENVEFQYSGNLPNGTHSLYTSQTTATQAAVAAAKREAARVVYSFTGIQEATRNHLIECILSSIPAEANAALEKICMEVAKAVWDEVVRIPQRDGELAAIVTYVIEKGERNAKPNTNTSKADGTPD